MFNRGVRRWLIGQPVNCGLGLRSELTVRGDMQMIAQLKLCICGCEAASVPPVMVAQRKSRDHRRPGTELNKGRAFARPQMDVQDAPRFNSLRPVAVRISPAVRITGVIESATAPIPAGPTVAVPEVAASGDADMGPANVHVRAANMHTGSASAEVTTSKVTATKVTAAKVAAASVSATSMTSASTTSKGHRRDRRTTQKDGGGSYEQCFSQHQDLHHRVLSIKLYRGIFLVIDAVFRTNARRRQFTTCTIRQLSANVSNAINFSVRPGYLYGYRSSITQSSELRRRRSRRAAFTWTW